MAAIPPPMLIRAAAAYGLTVHRYRQVRRIWRLETNRGCFALKGALPPANADLLYQAENHLAAGGFARFPRLVPTADGRPECVLPSGERLVLRTWLPGTHPLLDLEHPRDLSRLAEAVAEMHQASLGWKGSTDGMAHDSYSWPALLAARTADLDRFLEAGRRGRFARSYRTAIPAALEDAALTRDLLAAAGCEALAVEARDAGGLCHGDLAANNALVHGGHAYLLDLDRAESGLFPADLAKLIQRVVAAQDWDPRPAEALIQTYSRLRPLSTREIRVLTALLHWPQSFWRLGSQYFVERLARSERFFVGRLWHWTSEVARRQAFLRHCREKWW